MDAGEHWRPEAPEVQHVLRANYAQVFPFGDLQSRCPSKIKTPSHGFAHPQWIWQRFHSFRKSYETRCFLFFDNVVGPLNPESCNPTTLCEHLRPETPEVQNVREGLRTISEFGPRSLGPRGLFCNSYKALKHHTNVTIVTQFWWRLMQCANCRTDLQTPICNANNI